MAQCLEFDQVITRAGAVPASSSAYTSSGVRVDPTPLLLYTVPIGHAAKINQAKNLGSGLMYGVTSAAGIPSGAIALSGSVAGQSTPSRHRDLSNTWMTGGDKLYVYDYYDPDNTTQTSHPDGFYVVIVEYDVITGC